MLFLTLATALTANAATSRVDYYAIAGVGVAIVSGVDLDASRYDGYPVNRYTAVAVLDPDATADYRWYTLATDRAGDPLVGAIPASNLPDSMLSALDEDYRGGWLLAVVDADVLTERVDSALVGPCGDAPDIDGVIAPELLEAGVARTLYYDGLDFSEAAVAIAGVGVVRTAVTDISARATGLDPIAVVEPDSITPGGWCGAAPTPHP